MMVMAGGTDPEGWKVKDCGAASAAAFVQLMGTLVTRWSRPE